MVHHLQHLVDLVEICRLKGIEQVVVSPGSRNAPLIKLFASISFFKLHSIVDERSAAFYGLGIALTTQQPVALLCTSGTAVLNYAPALAEAYYQHVPLVAITADRPENLIDQQDNQTIRQVNVYNNFIKESIHLHLPVQDVFDLQIQHFAINKIINSALSGIKGPVHINVPIAEPLYADAPPFSAGITINGIENIETDHLEPITDSWASAESKLIICGEATPNPALNNTMNQLAAMPGVVVLAEAISNLKGENIISEIDRLLMMGEKPPSPELLISFGGPVVSKRLKQWLQKQPHLKHYRISEDEDHIDTYQNLDATIIGQPETILGLLASNPSKGNGEYSFKWNSMRKLSQENLNRHIENTPYSDFKAIAYILKNTPQKTVLHLGNSTPVRYAQLFDTSVFDAVYSNRGVSGIDGCVSTAAGFASQSKQTNLLIVGDLSLVYDSNGLWNKNLKANFKIVVINNGGGGIFRLLPGPDKIEGFETYIETNHPVNIKMLAGAYGIEYFYCDNEIALHNQFQLFMNWNASPALLEIATPRTENDKIYKAFVENMKSIF